MFEARVNAFETIAEFLINRVERFGADFDEETCEKNVEPFFEITFVRENKIVENVEEECEYLFCFLMLWSCF